MPGSTDRPYNPYSRFLRGRFGGRVYRVTVDAGFTCPNVDGSVAVGGCVYCDNRSFSPNRRLPRRSVREQVAAGVEILGRRYGADRFLAYFQAGTNTYAPVEKLARLYAEALEHPAVIGLIVGTRPDCVPEPVLRMLEDHARRRFVGLELGLQTVHDRSLVWMNRGHDASAFFDAVRRSAGRGLDLCAHVILGLPGESHADMMATAEAVAALPLDGVKIHNLHVVRDTPLEAMYRSGSVRMMGRDEYVGVVCDFLERLPAGVVVHRLSGDAPPDYLVAPEWCLRKQELLRAIEDEFRRRGSRQGSRFDPKQPTPTRGAIPLPTV